MLDDTEGKRAEEALRQSQQWLQQIFATLDQAVFIVNPASRTIIACNPAVERIFGYSEPEVLGRSTNFLHVDQSAFDEFGKRLFPALDKDGRFDTEFQMRRKSGSVFFAEIAVTEIRDEAGQRTGVVGAIRDITERKKAEEEIRRRAAENARLLKTAQEAVERRTILHRVSQEVVAAGRDREQLFAAIHRAAEKLMPSDTFLISEVDYARREVGLAYGVDKGKRAPAQRAALEQGLTGRVVATGQSILIRDWQADNFGINAVHFGDPEHARSMVVAPMRSGERILGVLSAQSYRPDVYTEEDLQLLELLAAHAASAIENARLFDDMAKRADEFAALYDTARALTEQQDLSRLLLTITQRASTLFSVPDVAVYLYDSQRGDLALVIDAGASLSAGVRLKVGEGMAGRVAQSRQPLVVDDYQHWPGRSPQYDGTPFAAVVEVPMLYGGELIGVLVISELAPSTRKFTPDDVRLLELFASQAAAVVHNARLLDETRHRADEFAALYDTALDLSAERDLTVLLNIINERARVLLDAASGGIYLYDAERADLELVVNENTPAVIGTRLRLGEGASGRVAQTRKPLLIDDYQTWEGRSPQYNGLTFRAVAAVPMLYGGELIGVMTVDEVGSTTRKFAESDLRLLELLAAQAAAAVRNARLLEETRQRVQELALLYDAGLTLNRVLDPRQQLEFLVKLAMTALRADRAEFFRFKADAGALLFEFGLGHDDKTSSTLHSQRLVVGEENTVVGWVATHRVLLNLPDAPADPRWTPIERASNSALFVPIVRDDLLHGVLGVLSDRPKSFTPQDERLLTLFANQVAVAMNNASLFEETGRRLQRLQSLREIDSAISSSLDARFTLNVLLDQVLSQLGVDAADVLLLNAPTQTLEFAVGRGFKSQALRHTRLRLGEGLAGRAALERRVVHVSDLNNDRVGADSPAPVQSVPSSTASLHQYLAGEDFISYYGVPLIAKGQVKGVLEVFHRAPFTQDDEWLDFLKTLAGQAAIATDNAGLFNDLQRSNFELTVAYDATIEGWSRALDLRDKETEGHTRRVTEMTARLARAVGCGEEAMMHIRRGALLHDIGKMGIPDGILLKPGPLAEEEWAIMRKHPQYAHDMLSPIAYLRAALDIPYSHHEKWDGTGYPRGLKGEQIPLAARIFAVVDVWDALRSNRPYRDGWPEEKVLDYLREQSGAYFDPTVVEAFLRIVDGGY